jgi:hypothetical protein
MPYTHSYVNDDTLAGTASEGRPVTHAHTEHPQDDAVSESGFTGKTVKRVHSRGYSKGGEVAHAHSECPRVTAQGFTGKLSVSNGPIILTLHINK